MNRRVEGTRLVSCDCCHREWEEVTLECGHVFHHGWLGIIDDLPPYLQCGECHEDR